MMDRKSIAKLTPLVPLAIALLLLLPLATACASGPSKAELDAEVKRLCAIDGGVRVYETVKLPSDKFNKWGQPNFYRSDQGENALGPEYIFKQTISYLLQGNPSLHRYHVQVFSRASDKLLGESIGYSRGGGDMPSPWAASSFSCPDKYGEVPLLIKIFIKTN